MKQSYIYGLTCPVTGEVRYIGKTVEPATRLYNHIHGSKRDTHKERWIAKLISAGLAPRMQILEVISASGDWKEAERRWIMFGSESGWPLTNLAEGGIGASPLTEDARRRKKASMSRPECRSRMSVSAKRRWADPEKRAAGVAAVRSDARRKLASEKAKLRSTPEYRKMMSERSKAAWADKEKRARIVAGITPAVRQMVSLSARSMWTRADSEKRSRMLLNIQASGGIVG